ncbi:MAG TPA: ParA family protein [Gammaproteobacteria bacterium]|nr:ParA family protein [Gammaproteobacteria bacterium]
MRVISVMNQKGGVGKTTTTLNLAHALARKGKRVLAIDLDPQAHLSAGFGIDTRSQAGVDDVLMENGSIRELKVTVRENLDLLPAGVRLGEMEHRAEGGAKRGWLLKDAIARVRGKDYVLVDCPPSSGILGMNALLASREVLVPVAGDFFSLQGLSRLMSIFEHIEGALNQRTDKWVVLTRFYERRRLAREVRDKILAYFPGRVLRTAIRETVALAESPGFGQTIFEYQGKGNGATDYLALADDLIKGRVLKVSPAVRAKSA